MSSALSEVQCHESIAPEKRSLSCYADFECGLELRGYSLLHGRWFALLGHISAEGVHTPEPTPFCVGN